MKVGRNDPCPCGSGKKFKKCHESIPQKIVIPQPFQPLPRNLPPDIFRRAHDAFEKQRADERRRLEEFGQIRPINSTPGFGDGNIVAVGANLYKTATQSTFTNFLFDHGLRRLGEAWIDEQNGLPSEDQHPLFILHWRATTFVSSQPVRPEGYVTVVPNGPLSFCERFYYDLYTVDDNNELREDLLHRLRNKEQFQGAMHELFVEATCLRAGFRIVREPLQVPAPKNAEFIAIHKETQQHIAVEAKSRHRAGVMGRSGAIESDPDTRFGRLINKAGEKDPTHPLAVFIDTNLPPEKVDPFFEPSSLDPMIMSEKICRSRCARSWQTTVRSI